MNAAIPAVDHVELSAGMAVMIGGGRFGHPVHQGFRFGDSFAIDHGGAPRRPGGVPMRLRRGECPA